MSEFDNIVSMIGNFSRIKYDTGNRIFTVFSARQHV